MESPAPSTDAIHTARALFPRGLSQPESGWRFSLDALLLGAFASPRPGARVLDLGCGCGPAGLWLLLRDASPGVTMTGLDISPDMVRAAGENAARLGLSDVFSAHVLDVRDVRARAADPPRQGAYRPEPESFDHILCNPPYRPMGAGRTSPHAGRHLARCESLGALSDFLSAAAFLLANRGGLSVVYPASRLTGLITALTEKNLEPKTLLPVLSRPDHPARLVLVSAVKNGGRELAVLPPLVLYREADGSDDLDAGAPRRLSETALAFCPCLAANP
ncbi:tRNA1(Val) (adenine(37)-N6)-methyltransferase [Desulfolutivibrio sp.]|uniref:tRNA1(Val) (adenine(37)-N6)-methyltransferase n=1 Tax=Desulfolutivibrio sp. TaxID=2773296 RepID=UPI002F9672AB